MDLNAVLDAAREALENRPGVAYAIVFGSYVSGGASRISDVDIAVKFSGKVDFYEVGLLSAEISSKVGVEVDLLNIDFAPPPLKYEIFKTGIPLLIRDQNLFAWDFARAIDLYLDLKPIYEYVARCLMGVETA